MYHLVVISSVVVNKGAKFYLIKVFSQGHSFFYREFVSFLLKTYTTLFSAMTLTPEKHLIILSNAGAHRVYLIP